MTKKEKIIKEFIRWIKADRPTVWVKTAGDWYIATIPAWNSRLDHIVDDKHAELRKLQIDKPDTKFEYYSSVPEKWYSTPNPEWDTANDYRVLIDLKVDTKVLVWNNDSQKYRKYFSHFKNGVIHCFYGGATQWSNHNGNILSWGNWELADEDIYNK